ncbi:hypothetical protein ACP275_02G076700 [Erythranthe tilingii]
MGDYIAPIVNETIKRAEENCAALRRRDSELRKTGDGITCSLRKTLILCLVTLLAAAWLASEHLPVRRGNAVTAVFSVAYALVYGASAYFQFREMRRAIRMMDAHQLEITVVLNQLNSLTEELNRTVGVQLDPLAAPYSFVRLSKAKDRVAAMVSEITSQRTSRSAESYFCDLIMTCVLALMYLSFIVRSMVTRSRG